MELLSRAWAVFCYGTGITSALSIVLYLFPFIFYSIFGRNQNLRKRYDAEWAIVTGASSGIGKAVVKKLARQGINCCVVALNDHLMTNAMTEFHREFPLVEFRSIPVDLCCQPERYMGTIIEATKNLNISIVVNNAGYLVMSFFHRRSMEAHLKQIEVNQLAALRITWHFYQRLIEEKKKGCILFTSSAVCYLPAPFASMYGATKSFLTHFATSLAIEAESKGIDVTVVSPSFTHTNLYAKTPKFGVINALARIGWTPEDVAQVILDSAGRFIVRDCGAYALCTCILGRILDANAMSKLIVPFRDSMAPPGASSGK